MQDYDKKIIVYKTRLLPRTPVNCFEAPRSVLQAGISSQTLEKYFREVHTIEAPIEALSSGLPCEWLVVPINSSPTQPEQRLNIPARRLPCSVCWDVLVKSPRWARVLAQSLGN